MRFQPKVDIWNMDSEQRAALQPGQWVVAGDGGPTGMWIGQKTYKGKIMSDVVAWTGNGRSRWTSYVRHLRNYATSGNS